MRIHHGMAVALLIMSLGGPVVAGVAQDHCADDDLSCRMDRLERQIDLMLTYLQRLNRDGPEQGGAAPSVEMNTDEYCGSRNCVEEAVKLCRAAGFARGVPTAVASTTFGGHLTRATCMD